MTPQEQRLIDDLFDRLSRQSPGVKDRQADALIQQHLRTTPDAAYMLVQSAIVFQHQIAANETRIRELEDQLNDAPRDADDGRGSFLGGLFGGGRDREPAPRRVDGGRQRAQETVTPTPWNQPTAQPARGGGFLGTALSTAAGVAGGMMVADSLRGMFGGDAKAGGTQTASEHSASDQAALKDADQSQDELQDAQLEHDDNDSDFDDFSGGSDSMDV